MTHSMQFNNDYREQIQLQNGTRERLRLIRPDDKHHMVKAFENLSSDSRYKRFLGVKKSLSEGELRYFTEIDQYNHFAIGAIELDDCGEEAGGVGIARFIRLKNDPECAEVGIVVIDSAQGRGVGKALLERLFSAALERGVKRLRFECLTDNIEMQRLVKKLSDHVKFENDDDLLIAELVIPNKSPDTNQYPMDVIEDMSVLIRKFSSEAMTLYADYSMEMFKRAFDAASEYAIIHDEKLVGQSSNKKVS